MLSRKNNDKVGLKAYIKQQKPHYYSLLKKELVSDDTSKSMSLTPLITSIVLDDLGTDSDVSGDIEKSRNFYLNT
jgi:hypothetical protein